MVKGHKSRERHKDCEEVMWRGVQVIVIWPSKKKNWMASSSTVPGQLPFPISGLSDYCINSAKCDSRSTCAQFSITNASAFKHHLPSCCNTIMMPHTTWLRDKPWCKVIIQVVDNTNSRCVFKNMLSYYVRVTNAAAGCALDGMIINECLHTKSFIVIILCWCVVIVVVKS